MALVSLLAIFSGIAILFGPRKWLSIFIGMTYLFTILFFVVGLYVKDHPESIIVGSIFGAVVGLLMVYGLVRTRRSRDEAMGK